MSRLTQSLKYIREHLIIQEKNLSACRIDHAIQVISEQEEKIRLYSAALMRWKPTQPNDVDTDFIKAIWGEKS